MERESTDPGGCDVEGNQQLDFSKIPPLLLSCDLCLVSLGKLQCAYDWLPGTEDLPVYGLESLDGGGFAVRFVCNECIQLAFRSLDYLRSTFGCVEFGGDRISRIFSLRDAATQVDQPANVVEASSDSDGRRRSGGCGCGEVDEAIDVPWSAAPSAAEGYKR